MPFNISELSASISGLGVQKSSHFSALVTLPPILSDGITNELQLRINSINLPGVNFGVDEIKHKGFGLSEKRPMSVTYDDVSVTIIADGQGRFAETFNQWNELILPSNIENTGSDNVEYFEYPENYYGGLEIYVYDAMGNIHTTYNFIQPFPSVVGSVQMAWESTDTLLLLPVTFSYRSYTKNSTHSGYVNSQT